MERPRVCGYDCYTNTVIDREMTDEEYAELLASGWTEEGTNEASTTDADTGTSAD
jgi:hypothetical protein